MIKREPGSLGARCWSLYGRCYLRHFNELDHELMSRLSKGYKVGVDVSVLSAFAVHICLFEHVVAVYVMSLSFNVNMCVFTRLSSV